MKLIVEKPLAPEAFEARELTESVGGINLKSLYLEGPMLGAESLNQNQRIYDLNGMSEAVDIYDRLMIKTDRAIGEMNHPESPDVNMERCTHLITSLRRDNNTFIGKARVMQGHPFGDMIAALVRNGVRVGMSSRALGEIMPLGDGTSRVVALDIRAIDTVHNPSFQSAFVNGVMESCDFFLNAKSGRFEMAVEHLKKNMSKLPTKQNLKEELLLQNMTEFFSELKKASISNVKI